MAETVRIQKAIADAGLMSRRAAEDAIAAGRVLVDGEPVKLGDRVDVETQKLTVDDVPVTVDPGVETHLVYKPTGVISTAHDPQGRETVVDLVESDKRIYPVGRLDSDSEGLILVSNDGELTNRVTHPRYGITKTYVAMVRGIPSAAALRRLGDGIDLEDGPARAVSARLLETSEGDKALIEIVMGEGRNREVRRMLGAVGHEVVQLVRTAIGPISDPNLKPGESRLLSAAEMNGLLRSSSAHE